jgi:Fe-S-cluster containining protein
MTAISRTPWNSIAEGIVESEGRLLGYAEARLSPCASCATSPCCTYLPLHTFKVRTLMELDHAVYLLNFDRIELGLSPSGDWGAYYRYPCRFLNRDDFTCRVHNQPEQPQICVHYNPYQCWYKRVLTTSVGSEFLRVDRRRLEYIISHFTFDETGAIVAGPDWATLVEGIAALPPAPPERAADPPGEDEPTRRWKELAVLSPNGSALAEPNYGYTDLTNPCETCQAYCCATLVFPTDVPVSRTNLDFQRFALGFPGVELGIADGVWSLVVRTTCRHLEGNRCSVYGRPERPLICKYYDAWKCTYKAQFGQPRPTGFLRVRLEEFPWLAECFRFDEHGTIVHLLPTEAIREHIETRWREQAAQSAPAAQPEPAPAVAP